LIKEATAALWIQEAISDPKQTALYTPVAPTGEAESCRPGFLFNKIWSGRIAPPSSPVLSSPILQRFQFLPSSLGRKECEGCRLFLWGNVPTLDGP